MTPLSAAALQSAQSAVGDRRPQAASTIAPSTDVDALDRGLPWPPFAATTAFQLGRRQALRDAVSSLPFLLLDSLAVLSSILFANTIATTFGLTPTIPLPAFSLVAWGLTLMLQSVHGLYPACGIPYSIEYRRLLRTSFIAIASLAGGLVLQTSVGRFPLVEFSLFAAMLVLGLTSFRSLARHLLARCDWWTQPVVLVGDTRQMRALYQRLDKCRNEGLRPLGILFDPQSHWSDSQGSDSSWIIGPIGELESVLLKSGVCRVAVADSLQVDGRSYHSFQAIPHVMLPTDLGQHPVDKVRLVEHDGRVELHCHSALTSPAAMVAKRCLDILFIALAAPLWLPLMVAIGIAIKFSDPGPIFFRQHRVGRFGRKFNALKFRSMVCQADQKLKQYLDEHPELRAEWEATHKLKSDPRVTWIGNFLRKSSLDELPQLLNVLCGQMSLVGPRPIIDCGDYDRVYIEEHPEVFELYRMVRPGITGLWQVSGRNSLPYRHRVLLDRIYLHNWSLTLDIFILWRTLKTAVFREGAY